MIKLISIILLKLFGIVYSSAELNLRIGIDPSGIIREGSKAKISLSAAGNLSPDDPDLNIQGGKFNLRKIGKGFEFMRSNQGVTRVTTHTYELSGEPGKYRIKGLFKSLNGTLYETETIDLQVREKTAQEKALDPQLIVKLAKNSPFIGEPILAEITLLLQPGTRLYSERNNIATLSGEGVRVNYIDGPKEAPPKNNKRAIKFLYEIASLREGNLKLTAKYNPLLQIPSSSGRRLIDERFDLSSQSISIESRSLPDEGKPDDFSGAIGAFSLDLKADPLKLKVGEPIAMKFTITGRGGFEFIKSPTPTQTEGWKLYDPTRFDLKRGEGTKPSTLIFSQNIVPEKFHKELPTFRLTVFDSNKEQYVTLISDTIPIQLEETSYKKTAIAKTSDSITTAPKDANKIVENNSDILMIGNSLTPQWSIGTTPAWKNRYVWMTHIILILLTITCAKFIKNRAQRTPIYEGRTPQQIINALKSKNLSPINFYIDAYECYEKIQPEIKNNDIKLTFENLSKKYEQIKYSGSNPVNLELPPKEEIITIIQELTKASK